MLFTVGYAESYEKNFSEIGVVNKLGKGLDHQGRPYGGGCVFESRDAAQRYLQSHNLEGYNVYGLDTTLDNTEQLEGEPFRRLLVSSRILRL